MADMAENGPTEACARALRASASFTGERTRTFFDSELALTYFMPPLLRGAYIRARCVAGAEEIEHEFAPWDDGTARSLMDAYIDLGEVDSSDELMRVLQQERELRETQSDNPSVEEHWFWPDRSDPRVTVELEILAAAAKPADFSRPLRAARYASYWLRILDHRLLGTDRPAEIPRSPWDLLTRYEGGDAATRPAVAEALRCWGLEQAAVLFQQASDRSFRFAPPPSWEAGQIAALSLLHEGFPKEALDVLGRMEPGTFEHEIVAALPEVPDEYQPGWGPLEEWNRTIDFWNSNFESRKAERIVWRGTQQAVAHHKLGDFGRALAAVPKVISSDAEWPPEISREAEVEWSRELSFLEGWHAGRQQAGIALAPAEKNDFADVVESQRRVEGLMVKFALQGSRVERAVEAMSGELKAANELLLEVPLSVSARLREDWKAEAQFELHSRALLRGWRETERASRDEAPVLDASAAVGDPAWRLMGTESRDDLIAWQLIKSTWGRLYLAQAALGPCRAFERELRRALEERTDAWKPGDLAGTTPRQLLDAAKLLPPDNRLHRVAVRADDEHLLRLRNKAAHPDPKGFTSGDMSRLERVLLQDGLDGKGLLGLVATYQGSHNSPNRL
jgi:hypothetical protein